MARSSDTRPGSSSYARVSKGGSHGTKAPLSEFPGSCVEEFSDASPFESSCRITEMELGFSSEAFRRASPLRPPSCVLWECHGLRPGPGVRATRLTRREGSWYLYMAQLRRRQTLSHRHSAYAPRGPPICLSPCRELGQIRDHSSDSAGSRITWKLMVLIFGLISSFVRGQVHRLIPRGLVVSGDGGMLVDPGGPIPPAISC